MKILAIGDIHGHNSWKRIVKDRFDKVDKIIFVGDYFDSFSVSSGAQVRNFEEILNFKLKNFDRVDLLLGNHDIPYIDSNTSCQGFKKDTEVMSRASVNEAISKNVFQIASQYGEYVFSHAGFSQYWIDSMGFKGDFVKKTNEKFFENKRDLVWLDWRRNPISGLKSDSYGEDIYQGPLWIRPNSLYSDSPYGITQVVGHTAMKSGFIEKHGNIFFIDCMPNEVLELEV
jgi:predicted MPP superfamily phosphohydrolase